MATFYTISERSPAIIEAFLLQAVCFCEYVDECVEELLRKDNCTQILLAHTLTTAETRYRIAVQALRQYGYQAEANDISTRFLSLVLREFEEHGAIVEKY